MKTPQPKTGREFNEFINPGLFKPILIIANSGNKMVWFIIILSISFSLLLYGLKYAGRNSKKTQRQSIGGGNSEPGYCPLCGVKLMKGEQLKSALFPEVTGSSHRICHIFGCPSCYPRGEFSEERRCPVCKKKVPADGYLIGRMFFREGGAKHVHIVGCTECHKK